MVKLVSVLIIIPFIFAFILPLDYPSLKLGKPFYEKFYEIHPSTTFQFDWLFDTQKATDTITAAIGFIPGFIFVGMYGGKYALYSQFRDTPKDTTDEKLEEIKVIEIQNMIRIIYAEILVFILLTILHIILPGQIRSTYLQPILGNSF